MVVCFYVQAKSVLRVRLMDSVVLHLGPCAFHRAPLTVRNTRSVVLVRPLCIRASDNFGSTTFLWVVAEKV